MLVTACLFDSALRFAAAPEHVLTGLIKHTILVCLNYLSTDAAKQNTEAKILNAASSNGIAVNSPFVILSSEGKYCGMNSMSMTFLLQYSFAHLLFSDRSNHA